MDNISLGYLVKITIELSLGNKKVVTRIVDAVLKRGLDQTAKAMIR
jgi:hypothetical protein